MKIKNVQKKLNLSKETVSNLSDIQMNNVAGGATDPSHFATTCCNVTGYITCGKNKETVGETRCCPTTYCI